MTMGVPRSLKGTGKLYCVNKWTQDQLGTILYALPRKKIGSPYIYVHLGNIDLIF
jgi:hypothetical protein